MRYNNIDEVTKNEIERLYRQGFGARTISSKLSISRTNVRTHLDKIGIVPKNTKYSIINKEIKDYIFDELDTEEKAYYYGWLMADGCILDRGDITIGLNKRDIDILEKFRDFLGCQNKISMNRKDGVRFSVKNRQLANGLMKHGMTPRKSHTATAPILPPALIRHFWRGIMDGDGYIGYKGGDSVRINIELCGSFNIISAFAELCTRTTGYQYKVQRMKTIFRVRLNGQDAMTMLGLLYDGANVYLNRKHNTYKVVKEIVRGKKFRGHIKAPNILAPA